MIEVALEAHGCDQMLAWSLLVQSVSQCSGGFTHNIGSRHFWMGLGFGCSPFGPFFLEYVLVWFHCLSNILTLDIHFILWSNILPRVVLSMNIVSL